MVTYSAAATVYRATNFDRVPFRNLGLNSGDATEEFSASVDLSISPLPLFPILIATPGITTISFAVITVTGGQVTVRLSKNATVFNNIDLNIQGTCILAGIELSQIVIIGVVSGKPYCEIFGAGK